MDPTNTPTESPESTNPTQSPESTSTTTTTTTEATTTTTTKATSTVRKFCHNIFVTHMRLVSYVHLRLPQLLLFTIIPCRQPQKLQLQQLVRQPVMGKILTSQPYTMPSTACPNASTLQAHWIPRRIRRTWPSLFLFWPTRIMSWV